MTRQLPKNDSWKLASTGMKLWKYVDEFALLVSFQISVGSKIKRKNQIPVILLLFQPQSFKLKSRHATTLFLPPSKIRPIFNNSKIRQDRAERLAL